MATRVDVNETLMDASRLLKARRYAEARRVLRPVKWHPVARRWLRKIDEYPPRANWLRRVLLVLVVVSVIAATALIVQQNQANAGAVAAMCRELAAQGHPCK